MTAYARFIKQMISSRLYRPDGTVQTTKDPKKTALHEGAKLAMACGMDEDEQATGLFAADRYEQVLQRYEDTHPETHLLRVQAAFLQTPDDPAPVGL
ncbi:hypothetical protein J7E96_27850 [Streptomyces sp. ISL-96]|uniref:hypothetical protein n=1 Tax=Streptomyces sp. ISL-96 TaxID=2819191 RepID=UPI001BE9CCDD|nr:hypothetical protein [Streptomyces sp. ISL-96]MBT2492258.1 hypothetical protein [Streptomyces sp. ISL-96]